MVLDDVRIWDHARSQAEISGGMNQRLSGPEPGLAAWYPLDDTVRDYSSSGRHGTLLSGRNSSAGCWGRRFTCRRA